jgi:hypothetical protein
MEAGAETTELPPVPAAAPPGGGHAADRSGDDPFAERPELFVAASFVGGLGLALVLRWLGPDD